MTASPKPSGGADKIQGKDKSQKKQTVKLPEPKRKSKKKVAKASTEEVERPPSIDDISYEEVLCVIRQVFSDGVERDRETATRDVARAMGYQRTGTNIWIDIDTSLTMASKRYILETNNGMLCRRTRTIEDYHRDFLKKMILSVIGTTWWEREDAIKAAAWSLGFARTGSNIHKAFKSAINGLIRKSEIETDGSLIRRLR